MSRLLNQYFNTMVNMIEAMGLHERLVETEVMLYRSPWEIFKHWLLFKHQATVAIGDTGTIVERFQWMVDTFGPQHRRWVSIVNNSRLTGEPPAYNTITYRFRTEKEMLMFLLRWA